MKIDSKKISNNVFCITFILTILAYFFFGFFHLTKFVTADEHYWIYERIPQYWNTVALHGGNKLLISDKPGITLALTSGLGLVFEQDPAGQRIENYEKMEAFDVTRTERIYLCFRLPILILNGLLLILLFWLIRKVTENRWIALWSTMLMALSPVLVGISQIVNPDALLWSFGAVAIFSYLALLKYNQKKYLALASIFMGLSILTKYVALILFPFFFLLLFLSFNTSFLKYEGDDLLKCKKNQIKNYFLLFLFSSLVVMAFLFGVSPKWLYKIIFGFSRKMQLVIWLSLGGAFLLWLDSVIFKSKLSSYIERIIKKCSGISKLLFIFMLAIAFILIIGRNIYPGQSWRLFEKIPFDLQYLFSAPSRAYGLKLWEALILQFNSLFFSLTSVALFFLLFLWVKYLFRVKYKKFYHYALLLTAFVLLYEISLIFMKVLAIIRYNIMLYPLVAFLAAIGVWEMSCLFELKVKKILIKPILTILLLIFSLGSLWAIKPFYFNFTNSLLPKKNLIASAWGYGGYEAAQYLNSLPQAEKLIVWSDYRGVCEFFKGTCFTSYTFDQEKYKVDYYVLTQRGKACYYTSSFMWEGSNGVKSKPYYNQDPEWVLSIGNRPDNYVKVVKGTQ